MPIQAGCEDLSIAEEVLNAGDFTFTFNFKSGYHRVDLFPEDRKYQKVANLQVHADLLKSGFLPNEAKGSHMHLGHYLTRSRSQPFHF